MKYLYCLISLVLLFSCENPLLIDDTTTDTDDNGKVRITITTAIESTCFGNDSEAKSRAAQPLTADICTRLDIAIYHNGERIVSKNQKNDNNNFGTFSTELIEGVKYDIVVIAHSGTDAMNTKTIEKIQSNGKLRVTDTFWTYQSFTAEEGQNLTLNLTRIVAKVSFGILEETPSDIATLMFYYKGGSSTFNGKTGKGCVNSSQTEERLVAYEAYGANSYYDIYTFPRPESNAIELEVRALSDDDTILRKTVYSGIPIKQNYITEYFGYYFSGTTPDDPDTPPAQGNSPVSITVDTDWNGTMRFTY